MTEMAVRQLGKYGYYKIKHQIKARQVLCGLLIHSLSGLLSGVNGNKGQVDNQAVNRVH